MFEEALAEAVGVLLSKGHGLKEVLSYSVRQLMSLVTLEFRRETEWVQADMAMTRIAFHADKDQYHKFISELKDGG